MENNKVENEQIQNVGQFYDLFKAELIADLAQSARIQRNGLDTLLPDMIQWMYRAHPIPVPVDISGTCDQICVPESSFIMKALKASDGTKYMVPHVHNYPSWQIKGSFMVIQQFIQFWYGAHDASAICPLCSKPVEQLLPHVLAPCSKLPSLSKEQSWQSLCKLMRMGYQGLVLFSLFPLLYKKLSTVIDSMHTNAQCVYG